MKSRDLYFIGGIIFCVFNHWFAGIIMFSGGLLTIGEDEP
jgi:hypothetical protein